MLSGEIKKLSQLSTEEVNKLRNLRWKARTDLGFLCREILNYPDVSDEIHKPILDILQKFPTPTREQFYENDKIIYGQWEYKPIQRISSLLGGRRVLILDPRGWLKTTINAQAHSIQWILNYPDVAIMIFQSNLEKAEIILGEIKKHFQYNQLFRQLFPEHCPVSSKADDFGTKSKFTTKARGRSVTRKEETIMASSIDAGSSGIHVDVMKFSDIVEPSNTGTSEQMTSVTKSFNMAENLLVGPNYWIDVEGTRYSYEDTYGYIIKLNKETPIDKRIWKIHARSCYKKLLPKGAEPKFTPEELNLPDYINEKGECELHWDDPERGFTFAQYESKRRADQYIFSAQQKNTPMGGVDGKEIFPVIAIGDNIYPRKLITRKKFQQNVRVAFWIATVDTAYTNKERSNYSAITIAAFASDGRVYVNEIIHGKFLPDELIKHICGLVKNNRVGNTSSGPLIMEYGKKLKSINIEETGFTVGLRVSLDNFQQTNNIFLPIEMIKRDNQLRKEERIQNTLQPYYAADKLIFLEDLLPMQHLAEELRQFPKSSTDDILDTLADLFQNKDWFGREIADYTVEQFKDKAFQRMLGLEEDSSGFITSEYTQNSFFNRTGGL